MERLLADGFGSGHPHLEVQLCKRTQGSKPSSWRTGLCMSSRTTELPLGAQTQLCSWVRVQEQPLLPPGWYLREGRWKPDKCYWALSRAANSKGVWGNSNKENIRTKPSLHTLWEPAVNATFISQVKKLLHRKASSKSSMKIRKKIGSSSPHFLCWKPAAAEGCFLSKYTHRGVPGRQGSRNSRVRRYSIFESVQ